MTTYACYKVEFVKQLICTSCLYATNLFKVDLKDKACNDEDGNTGHQWMNICSNALLWWHAYILKDGDPFISNILYVAKQKDEHHELYCLEVSWKSLFYTQISIFQPLFTGISVFLHHPASLLSSLFPLLCPSAGPGWLWICVQLGGWSSLF